MRWSRHLTSPALALAMLAALAACEATTSPPPRVSAKIEPLVVGTSPEAPLAKAVEAARGDAPRAASRDALDVPARDPRLARPPRARALVVMETQQLEALFAATAKTAPDRPALARRLAEDYAELARVADAADAAEARKKAIQYYELVVSEHPQSPALDEAFYYAGLERELAGDYAAARRHYYTLISRVPSSRLVPLAFFAFGELFLSEAADDPSRLDLALQAYREVMKTPPASNTVYPHALLRAGRIYELQGDRPKAAASYVRLLREFPASDAAEERRRTLAREATPPPP